MEEQLFSVGLERLHQCFSKSLPLGELQLNQLQYFFKVQMFGSKSDLLSQKLFRAEHCISIPNPLLW